MQSLKLQGKVALVTGGSSGIGLATAQLFQAHGASVVVTGRDGHALSQAADLLHDDALVLQADSGNLADIDKTMAQINERHRRLDVLFVNAGIAQPGLLEQVSEASFDAQVNVNLKGAFFTIQKAIPLIPASGASIIVTTSVTNQLGTPNFMVYAAAKAALRSLVKSLALELIERNIRINALSPGPINTPIFDRLGLPRETIELKKRDMAAKSPSRRMGLPSEVAQAALFLASDESSYIVGTELVIDGGISLL